MEDHNDEIVAALKLVGELLTKSKSDHLQALLAGEATLGVVPKGWKIMPPGSRAPSAPKPPKREIPPPARVRAMLLEISTDDERERLLHGLGMNTTQARQLAKALGVSSAGRSTIDQAIAKIVDHFSGANSSGPDQ